MPIGKRAISAKTGPSDINVPINATGIRMWSRYGGITVDDELLWRVTATMGTRSLNVLSFISHQLFAKTFPASTERLERFLPRVEMTPDKGSMSVISNEVRDLVCNLASSTEPPERFLPGVEMTFDDSPMTVISNEVRDLVCK